MGNQEFTQLSHIILTMFDGKKIVFPVVSAMFMQCNNGSRVVFGGTEYSVKENIDEVIKMLSTPDVVQL